MSYLSLELWCHDLELAQVGELKSRPLSLAFQFLDYPLLLVHGQALHLDARGVIVRFDCGKTSVLQADVQELAFLLDQVPLYVSILDTQALPLPSLLASGSTPLLLSKPTQPKFPTPSAGLPHAAVRRLELLSSTGQLVAVARISCRLTDYGGSLPPLLSTHSPPAPPLQPAPVYKAPSPPTLHASGTGEAPFTTLSAPVPQPGTHSGPQAPEAYRPDVLFYQSIPASVAWPQSLLSQGPPMSFAFNDNTTERERERQQQQPSLPIPIAHPPHQPRQVWGGAAADAHARDAQGGRHHPDTQPATSSPGRPASTSPANVLKTLEDHLQQMKQAAAASAAAAAAATSPPSPAQRPATAQARATSQQPSQGGRPRSAAGHHALPGHVPPLRHAATRRPAWSDRYDAESVAAAAAETSLAVPRAGRGSSRAGSPLPLLRALLRHTALTATIKTQGAATAAAAAAARSAAVFGAAGSIPPLSLAKGLPARRGRVAPGSGRVGGERGRGAGAAAAAGPAALRQPIDDTAHQPSTDTQQQHLRQQHLQAAVASSGTQTWMGDLAPPGQQQEGQLPPPLPAAQPPKQPSAQPPHPPPQRQQQPQQQEGPAVSSWPGPHMGMQASHAMSRDGYSYGPHSAAGSFQMGSVLMWEMMSLMTMRSVLSSAMGAMQTQMSGMAQQMVQQALGPAAHSLGSLTAQQQAASASLAALQAQLMALKAGGATPAPPAPPGMGAVPAAAAAAAAEGPQAQLAALLSGLGLSGLAPAPAAAPPPQQQAALLQQLMSSLAAGAAGAGAVAAPAAVPEAGRGEVAARQANGTVAQAPLHPPQQQQQGAGGVGSMQDVGRGQEGRAEGVGAPKVAARPASIQSSATYDEEVFDEVEMALTPTAATKPATAVKLTSGARHSPAVSGHSLVGLRPPAWGQRVSGGGAGSSLDTLAEIPESGSSSPQVASSASKRSSTRSKPSPPAARSVSESVRSSVASSHGDTASLLRSSSASSGGDSIVSEASRPATMQVPSRPLRHSSGSIRSDASASQAKQAIQATRRSNYDGGASRSSGSPTPSVDKSVTVSDDVSFFSSVGSDSYDDDEDASHHSSDHSSAASLRSVRPPRPKAPVPPTQQNEVSSEISFVSSSASDLGLRQSSLAARRRQQGSLPPARLTAPRDSTQSYAFTDLSDSDGMSGSIEFDADEIASGLTDPELAARMSREHRQQASSPSPFAKANSKHMQQAVPVVGKRQAQKVDLEATADILGQISDMSSLFMSGTRDLTDSY
ncbi:hypothetical protein QJQ45_009596 [Haematococcus lacustris]|nr:hypothetical protein QJQ45_009596 [Haematococcus lacustris]